jgi:Lon protease-like protein
MNFKEMQAVLTQMLGVERQLQERQIEHSHNLLEIEEKQKKSQAQQDKTQAQLDTLVMIVSRFVEATNTRLDNLEDK